MYINCLQTIPAIDEFTKQTNPFRICVCYAFLVFECKKNHLDHFSDVNKIIYVACDRSNLICEICFCHFRIIYCKQIYWTTLTQSKIKKKKLFIDFKNVCRKYRSRCSYDSINLIREQNQTPCRHPYLTLIFFCI